MVFDDIPSYFNYLQKTAAHPAVLNHHFAITYFAPDRVKRDGTVRTRAEHPLTFTDGAILKFTENINIVDKEIERVSYAYHYERDDFFFRYDKDPRKVRPDHALCHLHANQKEPRFITHNASFEQIFNFIVAIYYS